MLELYFLKIDFPVSQWCKTCLRDGVGDSLSGGRLMSDFDMMLERRRSEQRKRRKKKDIDLINDNDDAIARLIADMRLAAR